MQLARTLYRLFAFLLRYSQEVRHARLLGAIVILAGIVSGLAHMALIGIVNHAINAPGPRSPTLAWLFAGICILLPVMRYAAEIPLMRLTEQAMLHLRLGMSRRILAAPLRKLEEVGSPGLLATLTSDIPAVVGTMSVLPALVTSFAMVVGSLAYMGFLSWRMLLLVLLFLGLAVVAYQIPAMRAQRHLRVLRERVGDLFQHFRAVTEAVKELKLHEQRRHAFLEERLRETASAIGRDNVAAQRLFTMAASWGQVLVFALIGTIVFLLPMGTGEDAAVLTGYTLAILYIVNPIQGLMSAVPQLSRAVAAMAKVEQMGLSLEKATPAVPQPAPGTAPVGWRSLELCGVTHAYPAERDGATFTLGPVNLSFQPGEVVFVTGGNGSGKTTLAKLLTGLYTPEAGEIRLDGAPITQADLARYHSLFAVVFSDFHLFDSLLGLEQQELDAQARYYLEELHLDHKVTVEEGKLSTVNLSQGQRKRLALLTAYLEDRPIYLFDEWAADQDPHFKKVFYEQLLGQLRARGKTVLVISHDDRYYHVADRLIKLDSGQVVHDSASGTLPGDLGLSTAGPATLSG